VIADGLVANGDPGLLRAMLENLLGNSWKFTRKHAVARIEVGATERNGERAYFVRDDGAGFDMAYADKLFRPFQRLHTMEDFEGTGIGLATVQRIVLRHGGRVWGEGGVERGATFYFVL
jgi:light-regulated signal transduction histidine kinase (bacteriophytochrome)